MKQILSSCSSQASNTTPNSNNNIQTKLQKITNLEHKLSKLLASTTTTNNTNTKTNTKTKTKTNNTKTNNTKKTNEASTIRITLCELYSDILLTNPTIGYRKDIPNKLWRSCFYARINELRNRISKEKNRLKKIRQLNYNLAADMSSGHGHGKRHAVSEQEKRITDAEGILNKFLKEAVVLYEYLIDQLHATLIDYSYKSDNDEEDTDSDDDDDSNGQGNNDDDNEEQGRDQQTPTTTSQDKIMFVVPTLFRIYIHLGDLHRYSGNYNAAEGVYIKASYLAPGKGNPYNQLAVCAQINDTAGGGTTSSNSNSNSNSSTSNNNSAVATSAVGGNKSTSTSNPNATTTTGGGGSNPLPAVALYWYCRSLLASHDAFVTSKSNLERLFISNKKWIQESNVKTFCDVAKQSQTDTDGGGGGGGKARVIKTIAKRKFLSHFVDFQGTILAQLKKCMNDENNVNDSSTTSRPAAGSGGDLDKLILDMDDLIGEFGSVLESSAFGDAFLIKMVCINVFTLWNAFDHQKKAPTTKLSKKQKVELFNTNAVAMIFTMKFGRQLCSDLVKALEKGIAKQKKQGKSFGSIRIIGPFFLLCEFISNECELKAMKENLDSNVGSLSVLNGQFESCMEDFMRGVAQVTNIIQGSPALVKLIESKGDYDLKDLPDDFQSLVKGYTPFLSLNKHGGSGEGGDSNGKKVYLSPKEAYDALELDQSQTQQSQSSQRSKKSTSSQNGNDNRSPVKIEIELKVKLQRFMKFIDNHLQLGDLVKAHDGMILIPRDVVESMETEFDANLEDGNIDMEVDDDIDGNNDGIIESPTETQDQSEEKNQDVLVYTTAESGKPALLMPGAFLLGENISEEKEIESKDVIVNESSILSEVTMAEPVDDMNKFSLPTLLNPRLFNDQAMNVNPTVHTVGLTEQVTAAPMSLLGFNTISQTRPSVRPPPGFHSEKAAAADNPVIPAAPPGLQSIPSVAKGSLPILPTNGYTPHRPLPQTANPFVEPMEYSTSTPSSYALLPPLGQRPVNSYSRSNPQSMSSFISHHNVNASMADNQNGLDGNFDYGRFGLSQLGIFGDASNDVPSNFSVDSLFGNPIETKKKQTQNPFVFD
jgi:hypothetical protein